jgi:hypothetical protein
MSNSNKYLVMSPRWDSTSRLTDCLTVSRNVTLTFNLKPIFSSEKMLHKDNYRKSSAGKKNLVVGLKGLTPRRNEWRYTANREVTLILTLTWNQKQSNSKN